jgi:hypothetical protein
MHKFGLIPVFDFQIFSIIFIFYIYFWIIPPDSRNSVSAIEGYLKDFVVSDFALPCHDHDRLAQPCDLDFPLWYDNTYTKFQITSPAS